jgi:hypothetical protein
MMGTGCYDFGLLRTPPPDGSAVLSDLGGLAEIGFPDAAAPDGGICAPGGAATACQGKGYLICEGFEGATSPDNLPGWTAVRDGNNNPSLADPATYNKLVTAPACHGSQAAMASAKGAAQDAYLEHALSALATVHVRGFYYLPSGSDVTDSMLLALWGPSIFGVRFKAGGNLALYRSWSTPLGPFVASVPNDRWFCLELYLKIDPTAGEISVSLDGMPVFAQQGVPTIASSGGPYSQLFSGVIGTQTGQADSATVYMDELVVSSTGPIGCN